jgi:hypothetical protein
VEPLTPGMGIGST